MDVDAIKNDRRTAESHSIISFIYFLQADIQITLQVGSFTG